MSEWDFGYGREPTEHHEPRYPQQPEYSYPEQQEPEYPYPYPQPPGGPGGAAYVPGDAGWSGDAGWPGDPGWSEVAGWPGADGYPAAEDTYDPPTAYPITYERDEFEGRASPARDEFEGRTSPAQALPRGAPKPGVTPGMTPPYSPWPDAPDPGDRFDTESPAHEWRPAPAIGDRDAADRTQAWYPGRPQYPDGSAYPGLDKAGDPPAQAGAGWPRGAPPPPEAREWQPTGAGSWRDGAEPRRTGAGSWRDGAGSWRDGAEPWPRGDRPWPPGDDGERHDQPTRRGRWLIPVALAVAGAAVGAAIVMFALGHSRPPARPATPRTGTGSSARAAGPPAETGDADTTPLTAATARSVLAGYTAANNSANARRNAATLATVETGGSYAIDAGLYTVQAADGAAPYAAFAPVTATYYIPRAEPADGTRWFVVQVANAFSANPKKVTSTEYLLFTQAASGGRWLNAVEPYLVAGANAPQVAVSGGGLATAVSPTATSLAIAPGQLAERTATAIDGTGTGVTVADPGALADRSDQRFWRGKLPTATVTDAHAAATGTGTAGQTFALLTTNGGALVFYTDAAELQITPPAWLGRPPDRPGFLLRRPGPVPGRAQLPRPVRRRRPPGRRGHAARRRRVLRHHRQELTPLQRPRSALLAVIRTRRSTSDYCATNDSENGCKRRAIIPDPTLLAVIWQRVEGADACGLDAAPEARAARGYCRGASREGEVKSPPRYLKVTSSGSGSP